MVRRFNFLIGVFTFFGGFVVSFFFHRRIAGISIDEEASVEILQDEVGNHSDGKDDILVDAAIFSEVAKDSGHGREHNVEQED